MRNVKPESRSARRLAGVFVILGAVFWWHAWVPALLVAAFVTWIVFHKRLEGPQGDGFRRVRQRLWPPASFVLIVLIVAGTAVYSVSNHAIEPKMLPIALNLLALLTVVFGTSYTRRSH